MIFFARFIVISLHSGPVILNDGLIIVVFLGKGGSCTKNETSASTFRGRGAAALENKDSRGMTR